jgi:hypothetical protein
MRYSVDSCFLFLFLLFFAPLTCERMNEALNFPLEMYNENCNRCGSVSRPRSDLHEIEEIGDYSYYRLWNIYSVSFTSPQMRFIVPFLYFLAFTQAIKAAPLLPIPMEQEELEQSPLKALLKSIQWKDCLPAVGTLGLLGVVIGLIFLGNKADKIYLEHKGFRKVPINKLAQSGPAPPTNLNKRSANLDTRYDEGEGMDVTLPSIRLAKRRI